MGTGNGSGGELKALIASDDAIGVRLDAYLAAQMPAYISRSRIKDLIKNGQVLLEGDEFKQPNHRLSGGERIELVVPEPEDASPKPEDIPLDVLFEDDHIIVINKPAGMVVHPAAGNWTGTLVNALLYHCGASLSGIGGVRRPGIVHRLDKDTTGVMVVAKNDAAHASLSAQFADHGKTGPMERAYAALVWGAPPRMAGTIDYPLGRSAENRLRQAVVPESRSDARHAVTHYQVEHMFQQNQGSEPIASLIKCRLETGRTHQIRVHMAEIGNPLLGDQAYGLAFQSKTARLPAEAAKAAKKLQRQALHAQQLGIVHPQSGQYMEFTAPLPEDMSRLIGCLKDWT